MTLTAGGGLDFVPLDSRASSRMTARGAVSRQKERGLRAVILAPAVILVTPVSTAIGWGWGESRRTKATT